MWRSSGDGDMRHAFSTNDHSSTPHTNPASRRVISYVGDCSITVSMTKAIASVVVANPIFSIVCHARRLSSPHRLPSRRLSAIDAHTPVRKSKRINPTTDHTKGVSGANRAAMLEATPLQYLYKAPIHSYFVQHILPRVVLGIVLCVLL